MLQKLQFYKSWYLWNSFSVGSFPRVLRFPPSSVYSDFLHHPGTPVSSTNKTEDHDIAEILLKVALNTISQTKPF